jgi:hypothetical protein
MLDARAHARKGMAILLPKQHIFLLSHMRAYTSLFGHILGSNPEICGYYEMHIGYHSWKSLIRQKLLYFKHETPKSNFVYMFDKVLHNDHNVALAILDRRRTKTIFCLRQPQKVIPSILRLYQEIDPSHPFNSESFATNYYIQRLTTLESIANAMNREFFYFDAEAIKSHSQECLKKLSDWLQLTQNLSPNYAVQRNTSKKGYGDTSPRIDSGRISDDPSPRIDFKHDAELIEEATLVYHRVRKTLIDKSAAHCTM